MTHARGVGVVVLAAIFGLAVAMLTVACDDADQSPAHVVTPAVEQPAVPPSPAPAPSPIPAGSAMPESASSVVAEPTPARQEPSPTLVPQAAAQRDATAWLLEQLRHAKGFRVRVSAAVALGHKQNAAAEAGLIAALHDDHPAVRAAAASALSRFSSAAVQQALQQAQRSESDPTAARTLVRAGQAAAPKPAEPVPVLTARRGVYLSVSKPRTKGPFDAEVLSHADTIARAAAQRLPSARLATRGESRQGAENVLQAEGRAGYQLDTTFGVEEQAGGARATANVLVATYPGLALLGATKGAATVSGDPRNPAVQRMAMDAAIESAFFNLRRVFEADRR